MTRSHSTRYTIAYRLTELLRRLNEGERLDPQALARKFEVNLRTIQRDLNERLAFLDLASARFESHQPFIQDKTGKHHGSTPASGHLRLSGLPQVQDRRSAQRRGERWRIWSPGLAPDTLKD
jgi:hypothetical protein